MSDPENTGDDQTTGNKFKLGQSGNPPPPAASEA